MRLRPASAPTPRCEPMWVFTMVAPYDGARCISITNPSRDREAKGSAVPARLMRYEAWMAITSSPSRAA